MVKKEQLDRIIEYLRIVEEQPKFHFSQDSISALAFINGFKLACAALEIEAWEMAAQQIESTTNHES